MSSENLTSELEKKDAFIQDILNELRETYKVIDKLKDDAESLALDVKDLIGLIKK